MKNNKIQDDLHQECESMGEYSPGEARAILNKLLSKGASITSMESGMSAVHRAAGYGNLDFLMALLETPEGRAMMNIGSKEDGMTPLMMFCSMPEQKNVRYMLDILLPLSDLNSIDNEGNTPLHLSVAWNNKSIIKKLANEISCARQNKKGETALHIATEFGVTESIKLLSKLTSMDVENDSGETPIMVAQRKSNEAAEKLFVAIMTKREAAQLKKESKTKGGANASRKRL